ncbi:hypothetical protein [Porphyromonas circumdentaria]|uniref:hypothetical protein n=1 Tax=Porphyromonas circumdentaria TaxID=29524 RepID=UPI00099AA373|nr:hypothetical protein [Porphyromonas circumdentaria]MBB6276351.1 hypothetical protein [Porphyromonas circumdentaria]MDO4722356.1 hypothetical protein [Porphyromonas circumdentaria]
MPNATLLDKTALVLHEENTISEATIKKHITLEVIRPLAPPNLTIAFNLFGIIVLLLGPLLPTPRQVIPT